MNVPEPPDSVHHITGAHTAVGAVLPSPINAAQNRAPYPVTPQGSSCQADPGSSCRATQHQGIEIAFLSVFSPRDGSEDSRIHAAMVRDDRANALAVHCEGL